jgi:hypothetical protein
LVSASGVITNPAWYGYQQSSYINSNVTFAGGFAPGQATMTLPMGAATNSPIAIIQLPTSTDSSTNPLSLQRYFYKADLTILVTNFTSTISSTNVTNTVTTVNFKNSMFDTGLPISFTNYSPSTITNNTTISNNVRQMATNWAWWGIGNWLSTNTTFYDARQGQTNHVTQINVTNFGLWMATNTNVLAKWNNGNPFNGVIYIADSRTTNGQYMNCVRLTNGQVIPTIAASNIAGASSYTIPGLTVATINPIYIAGLYNCPSTNNLNSSNVSGTQPCSVIADAFTVLSPSWSDANSWAMTSSNNYSTASSDTVNTAIIAGNVPSTGSSTAEFSGGVHNFPRLLEGWTSKTLTLNTSMINLYPSAQATQQFVSPGWYYMPPNRNFYFDTNFTYASGLPPGTPQVNAMIRADWFNPPPNNVTTNPSPTLSFVPQ